MRYTLKEMVDLILNAMDSDSVNSITDTVESLDVANMIKSVYYDMATDLNLEEHNKLFELNASGDNAKPVLMTLPTNVLRLDWIKYDSREDGDTVPNYRIIQPMELKKFLDMQNALREGGTEVDEMVFTSNTESFSLFHFNDRAPNYYTTFDDRTLLFDAYDSEVDTTLQKSKTQAFGSIFTEFELDDDFYFDIDPTAFSLLLNKSKVRAFNEKKQMVNAEALKEERRQRIIVQKRMRAIETISELSKHAHYGRR